MTSDRNAALVRSARAGSLRLVSTQIISAPNGEFVNGQESTSRIGNHSRAGDIPRPQAPAPILSQFICNPCAEIDGTGLDD